MHAFSTAQSRSAWTEQEDEMLRQAVAKYGDRAWATVANDVPGRSSKSCSDRWRNFLSPDIEHPRKSPFTEWEVAVVVQSQKRYGNNWKAISMLLPGRTNRAVKNLFVGNLKWGARLAEIKNIWLEKDFSLEQLLEIKPDHAGGPVNLKPGMVYPDGLGSPMSMKAAASTSSAGSAWASDVTDQPLTGSPASQGTHHHGRKRGDTVDLPSQSPASSKRRRGHPSPVVHAHGHYMPHQGYSPAAVHPGALGPGMAGSPTLGLNMVSDMSGLMGPPGAYNTQAMYVSGTGTMFAAVKQRVSTNGTDSFLLPSLHVIDEGSPSFGAYGTMQMAQNHNMSMSGIPGLPMLGNSQQQMQMQQQQQQHGQQMVGQLGAWNHQGTLNNGSNSPFACMAGQTLRPQQAASAAGGQSYVGHAGTIQHAKPEPMQGVEGGDCTGNMAGYLQQQQQHQQQQQLQQSYWDSSAMQYSHAQHQQQQQQHMHMQHQQHFGDLQAGQQAQQQLQHQHAGTVTQLGSGLAVPGSPTGLGAVLHMPSQDLDQILCEGGLGLDAEGVDELLADPQLIAAAGMSGQVGPHTHHGDTAPESLADVAAPATAAHMARSNTWPLQDPAAATVPGGGAVPPAATGPASFSGAPGHVPGGGFGVSLPPRSISATGAGLNSQAGGHQTGGPDNQAGASPVWNWNHGPHSMSGPAAPHSLPSSGPPSHGGAPNGMPPERSSAPQYHQQQHQHHQQQQQLMLNMQLQQENLLLLRKVETLQSRLASASELPPMKLEVTIPGLTGDAAAVMAPAPTPVGAAPPPVGAVPPQLPTTTEPLPAAGAAAATTPPAPAAAVAAYTTGDLPRLPPVATRVASTAAATAIGASALVAAAVTGSSLASPTAQWGALKLEERHSGLSPLGCSGSGEDLALLSLMGPQGSENCLDGAVDW